VAIITGARRGIGESIANMFAENGANLTLVDIDVGDLERVANQIELKNRRRALPFKADVTDSSQLHAMADATIREYGRIDILVNNAGVSVMKPFLKLTPDEIALQLDVNLKSCFFSGQAVIPHMITRRYGRIINIASIAAIVGLRGQSAYSASKAGIIGLTKVLAMEMSEHNITVNAIAPGSVETEMTKKLHQPKLMDILLVKRMGRPDEIAQAALFLASPDADYITGITLVVDGGWSTGYDLE
jgi:3-oxoacyl-[acyl-carrier protein] reductase